MKLFDKLFRDKEGEIVIIQFPNVPLWGWIICTILALLPFTATFDPLLSLLARACLLIWAILELTQGVTVFRRALGAIVILYIFTRIVSEFGQVI